MTSWFAFVPRHVALDILENPSISPLEREQRLEVVALFADVAGFTPISEALGKAGRAGTEELTTILNSYFAQMIGFVETYGGIIGKFGGDAMTVLFPFSADTRPAVVRRAVQCGLEMQRHMPQFAAIQTSAGTFSLAMKAGLAMGQVFCTTVGDPALRLEYIIAGHTLDLAADAEHAANRGAVVVHHSLLDDLPDAETGDTHGDFCQVIRLAQPESPAPLAALGDTPVHIVSILSRYLHPTIAHRLAYGQAGFLNEHRRVTVLFVSFAGFDYDHDPMVGSKLQTCFEKVVRIIHRYDGYLNKIDMGDKGSKYVVLFGAPLAHENDEVRAVRCALDLVNQSEVEVRIGINTGFVFAGQVGSAVRQEYTVMGDAVNLSARLMQAAPPGSILASRAIHEATAGVIAWQSLDSIRVKGKAEPIPVFVAQGVIEQISLHLQEPQYALPMVGRAAQLAAIERLMDQVLAGGGQIIGITAEAGMGKSRLGAEVVARAVKRGFAGYGGECQSYGTNTSYLVWQPIWRAFFRLETEATYEQQISQLAGLLDGINPYFVTRLPLLGPVLNIAIPDNDLTASLEPQLRHELLYDLLLACIRHRAASTPLLFVLEDCHWIDPLSLDLFEYLARNCADLAVLILILYRPLERAQLVKPALRAMGHFTEITLAEFSSEESRQLIDLKMKQLFGAALPIPPALLERFVTRAAGNPFYIDELINLIHDKGIQPDDTEALAALDLPDSLYSLILSRIDQLAEDEKIILKVASVIGRLFPASWVWGFYPGVGDPERVKQTLSVLSGIDLTPLDKPEPELEYLFKHIITQEVAYESLAYSMRATLHEQLATYIERVYAGRLESFLDILAYHYGLSQNRAKKIEYFRRAADGAKANYANDAAISYYQRLLPLLDDAAREPVLRQLGEVWRLLGKWDEAEALFRRALEIATAAGNRQARAQCLSALGHVYATRFAHAEAISWLEQAIAEFEALGEDQGLKRALGHLAYAHWQLGKYDLSTAYSQRQLALAQVTHDPIAESDALRNIAGVQMHRGQADRALAHFERALVVARESHYLQGVIYAGGNIGVVYANTGRYDRAVRYMSEALEAAASIGYLQIVGVLIGNIGEAYRQVGDLRLAMVCNEYALSVALDLGDWRIITVVCGNIASLYASQQRYAEAEDLFKRSIRIGQRHELAYNICEYVQAYAAMLTSLRRYDEAQTMNDEALALATAAERLEVLFDAKVLAIRLRTLCGAISEGDALQALQRMLDSEQDASHQATLHYERWQLDSADTESQDAAAILYRQAYEHSPNAVYRQRYAELTGTSLANPPGLPPLPEIITQNPANLDILLRRLDVLMAGEDTGENGSTQRRNETPDDD